MRGTGGKKRGVYTTDEIEDALASLNIPFDWTEGTWLEMIFYPYLQYADSYIYALFNRYNPCNYIMDFECRYAGDDKYYIYVDDKRRLLTGLLYEYEKMLDESGADQNEGTIYIERD